MLDGIAPNFIPAKLCEWQGQMWVVGQSGNRLVAADLTLSNVLEWGGSVGQEDFISDVIVHDNILIVVGRRLEDGVQSSGLGVYPLGQLALKSASLPSKQVGPKVASMALTFGNNSIRMLRTFRFTDDNGTELTTHDFLALNVSNGEAGEFWAAGEGEEKDETIWTEQGVMPIAEVRQR